MAGALNPPPSFQYLVVAGGGALGGTGGNSIVGSIAGGGAGGFLESTLTNTYSSYTVTVGAAGYYVGQSGSNSQLSSGATVLVNAIGGGYGATQDGGDGASGGSGGGGFGYGNGTLGARGGAGTAGQGYKGGSGYRTGPNPDYTAYGGGGGAGGAGANSSPTGGARATSTILTGSVSGSYSAGFAGGGQTYTSQPGDQGQSGIIAIKYSDQYRPATVTGSPTVYVTGGHRIYVWTGSGGFSF